MPNIWKRQKCFLVTSKVVKCIPRLLRILISNRQKKLNYFSWGLRNSFTVHSAGKACFIWLVTANKNNIHRCWGVIEIVLGQLTMLWKESWQNMTFGIFAHGLQISFANTHWWQNLCAFVDILHAQHKHWSFLFSEWEILLILGIELKFYQNIFRSLPCWFCRVLCAIFVLAFSIRLGHRRRLSCKSIHL